MAAASTLPPDPAGLTEAAAGSNEAATAPIDMDIDAAPAPSSTGDGIDQVSTELALPQAEGNAPEISKEEEEKLLKEFLLQVKDTDRFNEVNRILSCFKLNPFQILGLKLDAERSSVRKQYRKLSVMVHPDKCTHPKASAVFDMLGQAQKDLDDDEKWNELQYVFGIAKEELRKERKKETKNDAAYRLAAAIHEKGREGVAEEYEKTDEFQEKWMKSANEVIVKAAWRKKNLGKRMKEQQLRIEEDEAQTKKRLKADREHAKKWEADRDSRVGTWRDFAKGNKSKKGKNLNLGGLRPPKLKMEDEDKTYIQRPVGEQFRPPPPVAARPRNETKNKDSKLADKK